MSGGLSRRELLLGAGGAMAGLAGVHAPAVAGRVSRGDVVAGVVERISAPDEALVRASDGAVQIRFQRTATFWRDHPADLAEFVPGDEVVAEGLWAGDLFKSDYLISMFRPLDGRVVEFTTERIVTTRGVVRLTQDTMVLSEDRTTPARRTHLEVGDEVAVLARRDPLTGEFVAVSIIPSGGL